MTALTSSATLLRPGDEGFAAACRPWNLQVRHDPSAVVLAASAADVLAGVHHARASGLGVGVMATGHGGARPVDRSGVLVNTSAMRGVTVDPVRRIARVQAGARWTDVVRRTTPHGLTGLVGSSPHVGVVGYTTGGGLGYLGRHFGFASGSVRGMDLVTADAELVRAGPDENADLYWGAAGGAGNFGVVTTLDIGLYRCPEVHAGNLFYPVSRAAEVLAGYAQWTADLPDEMASAAAFRRFPPFASVPEPLRGRLFLALRICWSGADPRLGAELVAQLRRAAGKPAVDTVGRLATDRMDTISADPVDPVGARQHSEIVRTLTPELISVLVRLGRSSPLVMLELRHLGGALARPTPTVRPLGATGAAFSLNAVGVVLTQEAGPALQSHLAELARALRPHVTGASFANFLDLDQATPARVRTAYAPSDWARLVALKDRYDPGNVFRFNRNISSSTALTPPINPTDCS